MNDQEKLKKAKKRVQEKLAFIQHCVIYVFCIIMFVILNYTITPHYTWWYWPALGWGIGIVSHFLSITKLYTKKIEKEWIQKELKRMDD